MPRRDGLDYRNLVLEHVDWEEVAHPDDVPHERWLADRYLNFAEDGRAGLADALRLIADPAAAPVVVHCMAGKDRTGVVCALTLSLLGVSDADIAADYALTDGGDGAADRVPAAAPTRRRSRATSTCSTRPPDAMLLFLDDLRARHGSVEEYVREIGLSRRADRRAARPPADPADGRTEGAAVASARRVGQAIADDQRTLWTQPNGSSARPRWMSTSYWRRRHGHLAGAAVGRR